MSRSSQPIHVLAGGIAGGLGQAFSDAQMANAYFDTLILDWSTTIAAGAASEKSVRNATGGFFVVTMTALTLWVPSPSASAINYTEIANESLVTKASNTWPTYGFFTAQMRFDSRPIGSNVATRVQALFGTALNPKYYPYSQPVIRPAENVFVNLTNNSPEGVAGQLYIEGFVVPQ